MSKLNATFRYKQLLGQVDGLLVWVFKDLCFKVHLISMELIMTGKCIFAEYIDTVFDNNRFKFLTIFTCFDVYEIWSGSI